jgi:hydrogenase maturation protein HypF
MIRRSRGYAPASLTLPLSSEKNILALGAMLKTTFTMIKNNKAIMSQYIGNTDSPYTLETEIKLIKYFEKLFRFSPHTIVIDKHPDFPNRIILNEYNEKNIVEIQHHRAHIGALLAEKGELEPVIGLSMDGTGYGDDGKIWGGEIFVGDYKNLRRYGHFKYINLPGGEKSIKEPWRFTLSLLYKTFKESDTVVKYAEKFGNKGFFLLESIKKLGSSVLTSSCGRLFYGIASLIGIGDINYYDGYLPVLLQNYALESNMKNSMYDYLITTHENSMKVLDFLPMIENIVKDKSDIQDKAYKFHNTLSKSFADISVLARDEHAINKIVLTGGVFQNTLLLKLTKDRLERLGFKVLIHSEFAPNDSSISLGQAFLAIGG